MNSKFPIPPIIQRQRVRILKQFSIFFNFLQLNVFRLCFINFNLSLLFLNIRDFKLQCKEFLQQKNRLIFLIVFHDIYRILKVILFTKKLFYKNTFTYIINLVLSLIYMALMRFNLLT